MEDIEVVRLKSLTELLDTGWEFDSDGDLHNEESIIFISRDMYHLLGKIIKVEDGAYCEGKNNWSISDYMVSKYLDKELYPEYLI